MELLEAVRGGDTAAFGALYRRHVVAARCLARQLAQGEEVEDILAETFAGVLDMIRRGEGPVSAFRPYLLTAVRRYAAVGQVDLADAASFYVDPELAGLERAPLARAYLSLPEQWRMVLWHAEIEGARPAEIGSLLGLSSAGATALARLAREGLRQAYLRLHQEAGPRAGCLPVLAMIVQHVEGRLPPREARVADEHIAECIDCRAVFLEMADVAQGLRAVVGQLVAGPAVDDYLAELTRASQRPRSRLAGLPALIRSVPTAQRAAMAGVAAATLATGAFLLAAEPIGFNPSLPFGGASSSSPADRPPGSRSATTAASSGPSKRAPGGSRDGAASPAGSASGSASGTASGSGSGPGSGSEGRRSREAQVPLAQRERDAAQRDGDSVPVAREQARRRQPGGGRPVLLASVDPLGALLRAQPGLVAVRLRNAGAATSRDVEATVTLPAGVTLLDADGQARARGHSGTGGGGHGPVTAGTVDGWSCRTAGRLVRCARGALGPGEVTAIFLRVAVAPDAPTGGGLGVSVRAGAAAVAATSGAGVRASGAAARFAADGRVLTRVVGNTLVSTATPPPGCGAGVRQPAGGSGVAVPLDLDRDATTPSSSCARLDLPAGARVLWAGLYWSASGGRVAPVQDVKVAAPATAGYRTVRAAEVARRDLPGGSGYQAFADVTSLVRTSGRGRWWVADASSGSGAVRRAGWSLVVVAADERQPYSRTVVLDTAAVVGGGRGDLKVPLDGLAPGAVPARIDLVVWNGEGVKGGVVTLGAQPGAGGRHRGRGIEGAAVALDSFHALLGRHPVLRLTTRRTPFFFGVAAVSARPWS
ncbi:hypothetical protein [Microbispora sp. NPDC049125]|uniref:hypothetical protein n=1 Tax=Microbispora sp. NPDC049125 TaxID=3154929 RepID=UPI0034653974